MRPGILATALSIPAVLLWVPESIAWLYHGQRARVLERVNRGLRRLGREAVTGLPARPAHRANKGVMVGIFRPELATTTVLVTLSYFLHIMTFRVMLKWVPKIVVDMGFTPSAAAGVLVWANVGGATGGATLGLLAQRFGAKPLTMMLLLSSTAMVAVLGYGQASLGRLSLICAVAGFCTSGAVLGLYALFASAFPTELRASGTGFGIAIRRSGAMMAPTAAGLLFQAGFGLKFVALVMGRDRWSPRSACLWSDARRDLFEHRRRPVAIGPVLGGTDEKRARPPGVKARRLPRCRPSPGMAGAAA